MENIFIQILNRSIAASWIILAAMLLRILLKKAPKTIHCCLWALAAVRLVCPISLESVLSLIPSAEPIPAEILYSAAPSIKSGIAAVNDTVNPILASSLSPGAGDSVNPMQIAARLGAWLWLAGTAAMLLYALASCAALRRRTAASIRLEDGLRLCDNIASPFIFGIFFPRIYLPSGLQNPQLAYVIAHEKAHLKRHDHWWKPFGFLLLSIYWFNPLCWAAYLLLCRDIELACDEHVVKSMEPAEKKNYAETLLSLGTSRRMISACPLAFGEVGIKERVRSVLNYRKPSFWIALTGIIACSAAAVCFLTNPAADEANIFDARYKVAEILYDAPQYNFTYTEENAPEYIFTSDGQLLERSFFGPMGNNVWISQGCFGNTDYSPDTLYAFFDLPENQAPLLSQSTKDRLGRVEKIWRADTLDSSRRFYLAMQTRDGEILLAMGYASEQNAQIRWLWKLEHAASSFSQEDLAGQISAMSGMEARIFAVYESDSMPQKLLAGFTADTQNKYGFALFNCDGKNNSSCRIKGYQTLVRDPLQSLTIGEDWGLDHSITIVLSRRSDLASVSARIGSTFQEAAAGTVTPSMIVFEWPDLLDEDDDKRIELLFRNAAGEELTLFDSPETSEDSPADESSGNQSRHNPEDPMSLSLEKAVSEAILEHCNALFAYEDTEQLPADNSLFRCESHHLLTSYANVTSPSGTPFLTGSPGTSTEITVYAMAMYQIYDLSQGDIREKAGKYFPVKLTFSIAGDSDYEPGKNPVITNTEIPLLLKEFTLPDAYGNDSEACRTWLQETFSGTFPDTAKEEMIAELADQVMQELTSQPFINMHKQSCYAQAVKYGNINTDAVIAQLFETIASAPCPQSSNPYDYLAACPSELFALHYYGEYTLQYISSRLPGMEQGDLEQKLMEIILAELKTQKTLQP